MNRKVAISIVLGVLLALAIVAMVQAREIREADLPGYIAPYPVMTSSPTTSPTAAAPYPVYIPPTETPRPTRRPPNGPTPTPTNTPKACGPHEPATPEWCDG